MTDPRTRPGYRVEPVVIAWNAVVFALHGSRDGIACIPRASLPAFVDELDNGRLDDAIQEFLASPPSGRVLRNSNQSTDPRLFDEIESPGAVVPPERAPGRPGRFWPRWDADRLAPSQAVPPTAPLVGGRRHRHRRAGRGRHSARSPQRQQ